MRISSMFGGANKVGLMGQHSAYVAEAGLGWVTIEAHGLGLSHNRNLWTLYLYTLSEYDVSFLTIRVLEING